MFSVATEARIRTSEVGNKEQLIAGQRLPLDAFVKPENAG
jgi:hypothetical protein